MAAQVFWRQVGHFDVTHLTLPESVKDFHISFKSPTVSFPLIYIDSFGTRLGQVGGSPDCRQTQLSDMMGDIRGLASG